MPERLFARQKCETSHLKVQVDDVVECGSRSLDQHRFNFVCDGFESYLGKLGCRLGKADIQDSWLVNLICILVSAIGWNVEEAILVGQLRFNFNHDADRVVLIRIPSLQCRDACRRTPNTAFRITFA